MTGLKSWNRGRLSARRPTGYNLLDTIWCNRIDITWMIGRLVGELNQEKNRLTILPNQLQSGKPPEGFLSRFSLGQCNLATWRTALLNRFQAEVSIGDYKVRIMNWIMGGGVKQKLILLNQLLVRFNILRIFLSF